MISLHSSLNELSPPLDDLEISKGPLLHPVLPLSIAFNLLEVLKGLLILLCDRNVLVELDLPIEKLKQAKTTPRVSALIALLII
jgi:hypothetical protein